MGNAPRISFGTDGARGVANERLLPEDAFSLGLVAARSFGGPIPVGRDTRRSGGMLSAALAAGGASGGAEVLDLGILPTPGVAMLAPMLGAATAAVVSASHNPFPDNGIKFFTGDGRKLSSEEERELERLMAEEGGERPVAEGVGGVEQLEGAAERYVGAALDRVSPDATGLRVLLDCANGAACSVAPMAFERVGASVDKVACEPDGTNINSGCGSTSVENLDASGNDVAFAFDGDGDRVLAVDEAGRVVDGDRIMAILARDLAERGKLAGPVVVTVMTNLGFFRAMDSLGIAYDVTPVGDRYVAEEMGRSGASLGGEQSGHVILSEHVSTGDGLVTALALLDVMVRSGKTLSELARVMEVYPQRLINVSVGSVALAETLSASETVERAISGARERLGEEGRILLRPSGTEALVRVMVEHADQRTCDGVCEEVARAVEEVGS